MRRTLWPLAIAAGLAAEAAGYGWDDPGHWIPDLLTGWVMIACGLLAPRGRSGALLCATGFAWFVGTAWADLAYLHRGPLLHLVLTYPAGRGARLAVAAAYVAGVAEPVWRDDAVTIALAAAAVAVAAHRHRAALGRERRERAYALAATGFVAAILAATALARLASTSAATVDVTLAVYETALCLLAIVLARTLVTAPWQRVPVTDLVVELGEARSDDVRSALARALGDPTLEIAYAGDGPLPRPATGRAITEVRRDGEVVAAVIHDEAVLDDPALTHALSTAAGLAAGNARLQAEVRDQLAELQASRRRLLRAGDEERRRLEQRLHDTVERRLATLLGDLTDATPRIREQLERTIGDLQELAAGLHPRELTDGGLAAALPALTAGAPLPVAVEVPPTRLSEELETAIYFVCSEALANVVKYASSPAARIAVAVEDAVVTVEISDGGAGGADPSRGTGLRGLADRVEALGGTLSVRSPPGGGTRLRAELPLRGRP